jgi:hypothetical protein
MVDNLAFSHNLLKCVVPTVKATNGRQNEDKQEWRTRMEITTYGKNLVLLTHIKNWHIASKNVNTTSTEWSMQSYQGNL